MKPVLFLLLATTTAVYASKHFSTVHSWKEIDYVFHDPRSREAQIGDGRFIPGNSVPISVEVDTQTDRIFLSMPRFKPGNAATLAVVSKTKKNKAGQPLLEPYPDWRWHRQGDCEGITSVFRVQIDECRRLWIVDTGTVGGSVDAAVGVNRVCPAQLLIFDLDNNRMIKRYEFPENSILPQTVLTTIAVDVRDNAQKCKNTFAYVADVSGFGIYVYDFQKDESWRVQTNEMFPYPPWGLFRIAGSEFDLMDGVLALALTPKEQNKARTLYFHSLAGDQEAWVSTHLLRNRSNFPASGILVPRQFHVSDGHRGGQAASEAFDENGVLFFSVLPNLSINCWNSRSEYKKENIHELDRDPEAFQFIAGVKVAKNKQGVSELWIVSSRFQKHMTTGVDPNDVNYRVMKADISKLTKGTPCAVGSGSGGRPGSGNAGGGGRPGSGSGGRPGNGNRPGSGYGGNRPNRPGVGQYSGTGDDAEGGDAAVAFPVDNSEPASTAGNQPGENLKTAASTYTG